MSVECHLTVDPESYYNDCLYDLCSCETDIASCMCPMFAAYSKECVSSGVLVDWRAAIRECGQCQEVWSVPGSVVSAKECGQGQGMWSVPGSDVSVRECG